MIVPLLCFTQHQLDQAVFVWNLVLSLPRRQQGLREGVGGYFFWSVWIFVASFTGHTKLLT